jgi:putative membrane protein
MLRITLAVVHLLALGIGLGAVFARARSAHRIGQSPDALARTFYADNFWGVAAILWIASGLWRALAGTEKTPLYYWNNEIFFAKMGIFFFVLALEAWPMVTLIKWRVAAGRKQLPPDAELAQRAQVIARISDVQTLLIMAIVAAAVLMARGYGSR